MTQIAKKYIFRYTLQKLFLIPLQFIINMKMAKVLKAYLLIIWNININLYSVKKNLRNCSHPNSVISKGYKGAGCWTELWKSILQPLKSIFSHTLFDRFFMSLFKNISGQHPPPPTSPPTHFFIFHFGNLTKVAKNLSFAKCWLLGSTTSELDRLLAIAGRLLVWVPIGIMIFLLLLNIPLNLSP